MGGPGLQALPGPDSHGPMRCPPQLLALPAMLLLASTAPSVTFTPLEPHFAGSADYYRQLWDAEGARIVAALERESGLTFPDRPLEIILRDGRPMTGAGCSMIRLRADATGPHATGTLVHELGHCLAAALQPTAGIDEHRLLYLFLYDVWTVLYGRDFADEMLRIERQIPSAYDYSAAWDWALAMTYDQRQARLRTLRERR